MYFKNIGLHFVYLSNKFKKKLFLKKKILHNCYFDFSLIVFVDYITFRYIVIKIQ